MPSPTSVSVGTRRLTRATASRPSATPFHAYSWWSISTRGREVETVPGVGWKRSGSTGVTSTSVDLMRERFGSPTDVLVTPVDPDLFHPTPGTVSTSRPRVLMLHHEYAWKGVADGLEAVARVRRHVPALRLVGFGVKPPAGEMPYDEFHRSPPQGRLAAVYSSCEIYLCPSWDEGLGMPPMQAMACGAALVTYDNGGCRDYARDGETALVARRRDVTDLAEQLQRLAADEALRARLAAAGAAFVTGAFDWERAVTRLEGLFARSAGE